jgi:hypothetical protein
MTLFTSFLVRSALVFSLFCTGAQGTLARGHAEVQPRPQESVDLDRASPLAVQFDALLEARFASASQLSEPARRRSALEDLSAFADITAAGLVNAAPGSELQSAVRESLAPVLEWHQQQIAAAIAVLPNAEPAQPRLSGSNRDAIAVFAAP